MDHAVTAVHTEISRQFLFGFEWKNSLNIWQKLTRTNIVQWWSFFRTRINCEYFFCQWSVLGKYVLDLTSTDSSKIRHNSKKESVSKKSFKKESQSTYLCTTWQQHLGWVWSGIRLQKSLDHLSSFHSTSVRRLNFGPFTLLINNPESQDSRLVKSDVNNERR